ncbi:MAG: hypothetical protein ACRD1K_20825 [Acidimicrobiales bacterium]
MSAPPLTMAGWLVDFDAALVARPERRERILAEVEAHLADVVAGALAAGMARPAAEAEALARFGGAGEAAARFGPDPGGSLQQWLSATGDRFDRWRPRHVLLGALPSTVPMAVVAAVAGVSRPGGPAVMVVLPGAWWLGRVVEGRAVRHRPEVGHRARADAWRQERPRAWAMLVVGPLLALMVSFGFQLRHRPAGLVVILIVMAFPILVVPGLLGGGSGRGAAAPVRPEPSPVPSGTARRGLPPRVLALFALQQALFVAWGFARMGWRFLPAFGVLLVLGVGAAWAVAAERWVGLRCRLPQAARTRVVVRFAPLALAGLALVVSIGPRSLRFAALMGPLLAWNHLGQVLGRARTRRQTIAARLAERAAAG